MRKENEKYFTHNQQNEFLKIKSLGKIQYKLIQSFQQN